MMYHLANLPQKRTGLPYQVWYSAKVPGCTPAIKVRFDDGDELSIEIESLQAYGSIEKISPADLGKIKEWTTNNKEVLLQYWEKAGSGDMDNVDVANTLQKV